MQLHGWEDGASMVRLYFKVPGLELVRPENFHVKLKANTLSVSVAWPQHLKDSITVGPFRDLVESQSLTFTRKGEQVTIILAKRHKGKWEELTKPKSENTCQKTDTIQKSSTQKAKTANFDIQATVSPGFLSDFNRTGRIGSSKSTFDGQGLPSRTISSKEQDDNFEGEDCKVVVEGICEGTPEKHKATVFSSTLSRVSPIPPIKMQSTSKQLFTKKTTELKERSKSRTDTKLVRNSSSRTPSQVNRLTQRQNSLSGKKASTSDVRLSSDEKRLARFTGSEQKLPKNQIAVSSIVRSTRQLKPRRASPARTSLSDVPKKGPINKSRDTTSPTPGSVFKNNIEGSTALSGHDRTTGLSDGTKITGSGQKTDEFRVKLNQLLPKTPLADLLYSGARLPIESKLGYQRELIDLMSNILRTEQDMRFSCEAMFEETLHRDSLRIHELERKIGNKIRANSKSKAI